MKLNVNKSLFFISLLFILIISIGAVSASNNSNYCFNATDLNNNSLTFEDIQNKINLASENDVIEISGNYSSLGSVIEVNKSVTIKGNRFTCLDGQFKSGIFKINADNVCLRDISFINCDSISAITWNGDYGILDNSRFLGKFDTEGSAITWNGDYGQFTNCVFDYIGEYSSVIWFGCDPYFDNNSGIETPFEKFSECCSTICQEDESSAVIAFRRDNPYNSNSYMNVVLWGSRVVFKEYKNNDYFCHYMVTSDGWIMGNGGSVDSYRIKKLESLFRQIVEHNSLSKTYLKKIKSMYSGLGHVVIKAPDGRFAVIYGSSYWTGVLKPGQFICVPNDIHYYKKGNYSNYDSDIVDAAISIGAHDKFGDYRRNINVAYAKATVSGSKKTYTVYAYVANDDGRYVGRNTKKYSDNIYFKGKFISKSKIPKVPGKLYIGSHVMVRTSTVITRTDTKINSKYSYIVVTLKTKSGKVLANKKISVKVGKIKKTYYITTNKKGVAKLKVKYPVGKCSATIKYSGSAYYYSSSLSSKITFNPNIITTSYGSGKYFTVKVLNGKNAVKSFKLKMKIYTGKKYKTVNLVTDSKGIAKYASSKLTIGTHKVIIYSRESTTYVSSTTKTCKFILTKNNATVIAPSVVNEYNKDETFNIIIKNSVSGKLLSGLKLTIEVFKSSGDSNCSNSSNSMIYNLITDKKGSVFLNTKNWDLGNYTVIIKATNNYYIVDRISNIEIKLLELN